MHCSVSQKKKESTIIIFSGKNNNFFSKVKNPTRSTMFAPATTLTWCQSWLAGCSLRCIQQSPREKLPRDPDDDAEKKEERGRGASSLKSMETKLSASEHTYFCFHTTYSCTVQYIIYCMCAGKDKRSSFSFLFPTFRSFLPPNFFPLLDHRLSSLPSRLLN